MAELSQDEKEILALARTETWKTLQRVLISSLNTPARTRLHTEDFSGKQWEAGKLVGIQAATEYVCDLRRILEKKAAKPSRRTQ